MVADPHELVGNMDFRPGFRLDSVMEFGLYRRMLGVYWQECRYFADDDVVDETGFQYEFTVCVGQSDHTAKNIRWSSAFLRSPGMKTIRCRGGEMGRQPSLCGIEWFSCLGSLRPQQEYCFRFSCRGRITNALPFSNIIIIHTFLYRRKVVTSEAVGEQVRSC